MKLLLATLALSAVFTPQEDVAREVRKLIEKLRSENVEEREDAARKLKELGKAAVAELEKAGQDKDSELALRARQILDWVALPKLPEDLEQVFRWLPVDTETAVVARGPVTLEKHDPGRETPSLDRILGSLPVYLLTTISKGAYVDPLAGRAIRLAVEGGRHFRSPAGLGMMPFEGCQILVFEKDLGKDGEDLVAAMTKAVESRKIQGHDVFTFTEKLQENRWTFLVARPRGDLLLVATQEEFLTEVLKRFARPPASRALPAELPEWKQVDTAAPFWAIRHYRCRERPSGSLLSLEGQGRGKRARPEGRGDDGLPRQGRQGDRGPVPDRERGGARGGASSMGARERKRQAEDSMGPAGRGRDSVRPGSTFVRRDVRLLSPRHPGPWDLRLTHRAASLA